MRESKILTVMVYLSVLFFYCDCEDPCDFLMSVDITNGSKLLNGTIDHDGLRYSPKQYFIFIDEEKLNQTRGCICLVKTCMRKCCPMGQGLKNNRCVQSEEDLVKEFNPQIYSGNETSTLTAKNHFGFIQDSSCREGFKKDSLNPDAGNPEDVFYLQENGSLYLPYSDLEEHYLSPTNYCLEAFTYQPKASGAVGESLPANWTTRYLAYFCIENSSTKTKSGTFAAGYFITVPFLLATFLVYAFVPELRNLQGKILMNNMAGLILGHISVFIMQQRYYSSFTHYGKFHYSFTKNQDIAGCIFMAFINYFFFAGVMFWLNIMCIDVWITFRNIRAPRLDRRKAEGRRYVLYCLYGWGAPVLLTALLVFMDFKKDLPESYIKPGFGQNRCWFSDTKSYIVYFQIPVLILLVFNLLMFSKTSYKILMIKRETAVLNVTGNERNDQSTNEKQGLFVYLKLFIFMGMSWLADAINSFYGRSTFIWITLDLFNGLIIFNSMYGVFIFYILVCKKRVKNLIIKRYNTLRYGPSASDTQRS